MQIETNKASIDTLSVTINALHVSGKQMTLAVFRQLPIFSAYKNDGTLSQFNYWGVVRYEINDCSVWVVASKDSILFRCPMYWHGTSSARAYQKLNDLKQGLSHLLQEQESLEKEILEIDHQSAFLLESYYLELSDVKSSVESCISQLFECNTQVDICKKADVSFQYLITLTQLFIAV